jgi:hypothetical protein
VKGECCPQCVTLLVDPRTEIPTTIVTELQDLNEGCDDECGPNGLCDSRQCKCNKGFELVSGVCIGMFAVTVRDVVLVVIL